MYAWRYGPRMAASGVCGRCGATLRRDGSGKFGPCVCRAARVPEAEGTRPGSGRRLAAGSIGFLGGLGIALQFYQFVTGEPDLRSAMRAISGIRFGHIDEIQQFVVGPGDEARVQGVVCGADSIQLVFCGAIGPEDDDVAWQVHLDDHLVQSWDHTPATLTALVVPPSLGCGRLAVRRNPAPGSMAQVQLLAGPPASVWELAGACARGTYIAESSRADPTSVLPGAPL